MPHFFSASGTGLTGCSTCQPGYYTSPVDKSCIACSKLSCPAGTFAVPCSPDSNAYCMSCSSCQVGYYLSDCSGQDGVCIPCTNKYEINLCASSNSSNSVSFYTGSGGIGLNNCSWMCAASYFRSGDMCRSCSTTSCGMGSYRTNCTSNADGVCTGCSKLPENALFTTAGNPYNSDNCQWVCINLFYRKNSSSECTPCTSVQCNIGEVISPCTATSNYNCQPCSNKPNFSTYNQIGGCGFECISGYFLNGTLCSQCNFKRTCPGQQRAVNCTSKHDTYCTSCLEGQFLENIDGSSLCRNCSKKECNDVGTYLQLCSDLSDAVCANCTQKPMNSYYDGNGSPGMNNCSWSCTAGFQKSPSLQNCQACPAGKFSQTGNKSCTSCKAGTYSAINGATSPDTCRGCDAGKFSTAAGATSITTCQSCQVGFYQEITGQSYCDACAPNTYGVDSASTNRIQCLSCPSSYTSTRGSNGQAFETSCICNPGYYRIDNTTVQCQTCPPGLVCNGYSIVQSVVNGSLWTVIHVGSNDYYRLTYCPEGYEYAQLTVNITSNNAPSVVPNQACSPCIAGMECTTPPCSSCTDCRKGYYKSCAGPNKCEECPANFFEPGTKSTQCQPCPTGTTTNSLLGSIDSSQCVCSTKSYNLGSGCQECPLGLQCFGNSTIIPVPLEFRESKWEAEDNPGSSFGKSYNLKFCPFGYFVQGSIATPGQLQCVACSAGFECVNPPCIGACEKCKRGFYKASSLSFDHFVSGSSYDSVSGSWLLDWINEPCYPCPVNSYRSLEGGTEVGSCIVCPTRSTTHGMNGSTSVADCSCQSFYYRQGTDPSGELTCGDCPQGCVCTSDRSCALASLPTTSMKVGDLQSNLKCPNPSDIVVGTWERIDSGEYMLIACPPGYTLQRSNLTLSLSSCIKCPAGSYLLDEVTSPSTTCKPCPVGAECPGGDVVQALPGYWQRPASRRAISSSTVAVLYRCPISACGANNSCNNNRVGPVSAPKINIFCSTLNESIARF